MTEAFVGVGSNLDPETNVVEGLRRLAAATRLRGVSTFYRTAPIGSPGSPPFANGAVRIETDLPPRALQFDVLRAIEAAVGRVRQADRNAPRTLDLDLLLCGDAVVRDADFRLPAPELLERPFVALPVLELAPELRLPGDGRALADLVRGMSRAGMEPLPELTRRARAEVLA
ncbi:MAG: 2-amino-4-hydroxy-6-hydroxymethyldihydropteridine diphosphokinase [Myxococcales bacterium]|nr:2-amino-4-hydroxy-6-hydroxymethyldihydropteridine diphosphokinase [Myxococcales bacterium]